MLALGRRSAPLQQLAAELGSAVTPAPCDVTAPDALAAALAAALDGGDRVAAVIVNAGLCDTAPLADPASAAVWRRVMAVNLDGAFNTLRAVEPRLIEGAQAVLISSGLGRRGRAGYAAYTAAKHGVIGLAKALALEWAPRRITVNAVCPGWVDTPMARADIGRAAERSGVAPPVARAQAEAQIPLGRFVTADEVAGLVTWLASTEANMITGQSYGISGGEVIG